jgi:pimeloyl-ACP methyl ester carboxylesterase
MKSLRLFLLTSTTLMLGFVSSFSQSNLSLTAKEYASASGNTITGDEGTLTLPENRANPASDSIAIHFVRLHGTGKEKQAPVIYLAGGPGSSCTWQASDPRSLQTWEPYLELGDVILLDQRGTGAGRERTLYIWQGDLPNDFLADEQVALQHLQQVQDAALQAFDERSVDLDGYTTLENARDMDDLRQALGYDQWKLCGFSYGTHLGQAYLKYFGDHVDRAVLVGTEGPNHTYKLPLAMDVQFQKLSLLAKADPTISAEIPDLWTLYKEVARQLDEQPAEVTVANPLTGNNMSMLVGSFGLNLVLRLDIGDASDLPVIPRLLYQIKQGHYEPLQWFVQKRMGLLLGVSGMASTMDAASGITPSRRQRIEEEERASMFASVVNPRLAQEWPSPDLGDQFRAPLVTDVPTLFLSGTLDFNTPPCQAEEVRWGYANSHHIIVRNAGHEQVLTHPKATDTIIRFLRGEDVSEVTMVHPALRFIPVEGSDSEVWHPALGSRK